MRLGKSKSPQTSPSLQTLNTFIENDRKGCMNHCLQIISRDKGRVGREVGDNLYFIHFCIVFFETVHCASILCQHRTKKQKYPQKRDWSIYYEVINKKKCGCVELIESTWKNVYKGKTMMPTLQ